MQPLRKTERSRVRRLPKRAAYDRETAYAILDAGFVCHVAFAIEGRPFLIPTAYWREGDHVYWHGSAASRMLRELASGLPCALAVTHVDGLVLARSGFHHSINYRSLVLFGVAHAVTDPTAKRARLDTFIERIAPGRLAAIRPLNGKELKATMVVGMPIDEGSAKVRTGPPLDDEADYALPVWAGVVPISTRAEVPIPDRVPAGTEAVPPATDGFRHLGIR